MVIEFEPNSLEVAIVGVSGRFPGSKNVVKFWENLVNGVESTSVFSSGDVKDLDVESNRSSQTIKAGAVLEDVDLFDASFFGISPREAEMMDPQHRLFLETAWEALENAGYNSETEEKLIGVYAGVGASTYLLYNLFPHQLRESVGYFPTLLASDKDYVPTRVSYKLNLKGPSVSVGTACSSSLVAVHLACQSLLSGECDTALAAGISIKVPQNAVTLSPAEIVSPDGHCKAFDAAANGTIGGNGIGVVVLKRLDDALADRDYIYAVIKGSAINNDGGLKVGYTAPSEDGQARAIRAAQIMAEVKPETIAYCETHGTGTALGDPIEIAAMTQAFRVGTDKKGYCAIGSVKTNIGHLDAAAGIAGLIKTMMALHHKSLPPSLNFETPNPEIDFENSPFYVNRQLAAWKTNGIPRRAGVSSFGFGGTNAHVILEEAPAGYGQKYRGAAETALGGFADLNQVSKTEKQGRSCQLLVLSAKTDSALEKATTNLVNHLKQHPELNFADVAYTLQVGRRAFEHRRIVVAQDLEDAVKALESAAPQRVFNQFQASSDRPVVFMFTGQGAQYANMAQELYKREPTFQQECDRCFDLLKPQLKLDLRSYLFPTESEVETATQQLQQTAIAQPALFIIEYALAKLWMSWGVHPVAAVGHSIGEYVAACLAGVFSLEDALKLVATRGRLMQQLPSGKMLSVGLAATEVQSWLNENLSLAASNAPNLSVVSGSTAAVEQLERQLQQRGIDFRPLHTSHAFHSQMMDSLVEPFRREVEQVKLNPPQIPLISNVTGTWIASTEATTPTYWARQLRQPVQFSQGITELLKDPQVIFLEVGPGRTLSTITKQQAFGRIVLSSLRHPQEKQSDVRFLLNTLGQLWLAGVQVNWSGFHANEQRSRLPLPTYPFERQRYWIDPPSPQNEDSKPASGEKKTDIADWFYVPSWKRSLPLLEPATDDCRTWLVFVDRCLGASMAKQLEEQGNNVIQVTIGTEFRQVSDRIYAINPGVREHYNALLQDVALDPTSIIAHLWCVPPNLAFAQSQELGFYSLLYLAQAIGDQGITHPLQIAVVSSNIHNVTGTEVLCPEKATVLGPVKVIPQEYSHLTCRSIDVVMPESGAADQLINQLIVEIAAHSADAVVAYRGSHRWLPMFEPVRIEANAQTRLRQGGVYLITGGTGGIGLAIAEYLAETVQAKLALIGRSFPAKTEWKTWLQTHDEQDDRTKKIRQLQKIEQLGGEVLVESADVADTAQMLSAVTKIQQQFGTIHGVIHAAGIPGGSIIQLKQPETAAAVIAPKVKGTLVLEQIFQEYQLDFFVLFSSLSAITGGLGQVDYGAANAFLDAFAQCNASKFGGSIMAINWDAWQQVGMGAEITARANTLKQERQKIIDRGLLPSEGIEVLRRLLSSSLQQAIVSTQDLSTVIAHRDALNQEGISLAAQTPGLKATHARPLQDTAYVAPRCEIEQQVAGIWQELLGIEQIGIHDNFFELGGHSLLAVQTVSRLRELFQVELPLRTLLSEAPTVAGIASVIATNLMQPEVLDEMAQVLAEIESLSPQQVKEQLANE